VTPSLPVVIVECAARLRSLPWAGQAARPSEVKIVLVLCHVKQVHGRLGVLINSGRGGAKCLYSTGIPYIQIGS
jgi:hypothetical protein